MCVCFNNQARSATACVCAQTLVPMTCAKHAQRAKPARVLMAQVSERNRHAKSQYQARACMSAKTCAKSLSSTPSA
eukprot:14909796-Alexandrium_andersonii.AAC.1